MLLAIELAGDPGEIHELADGDGNDGMALRFPAAMQRGLAPPPSLRPFPLRPRHQLADHRRLEGSRDLEDPSTTSPAFDLVDQLELVDDVAGVPLSFSRRMRDVLAESASE
jgi:hypothetical protein